ncbi:MAG: apolipoprotein N-acyltransferase [Anaerohalosphaeraceae bacterium]|nr:apolipoprotein N-acyltransferase [Anaerohalosphaeraceae bacterium]
MDKENLKKLYVPACLLLSGCLLTIIQLPFGFGFLGWVALVPFILVCNSERKTKPLLITAYIISAVYWLGNVYWLSYVTAAGWIVFALYMGLYWPLCMLAIKQCRKIGIVLWVSVPIIIAGAEAFQGIIFGGFNWRLLGQSQYSNITIIQIADIFGVAGISFLLAMVNGLIAQLIIDFKKNKLWRLSNTAAFVCVAVLTAGAYGYGRYRINQTPDCIEPATIIATVQSNLVITNSEKMEDAAKTFMDTLIDSRNAMMGSKAELIIWPETMVEAVLDESFVAVAPEYFRATIFNRALKRHSNEGVYLLVGAFGGKAVDKGETIKVEEKTNSVFFYEPGKGKNEKYYSKIHLVPFGEYLPFRDVPFVEKIMNLLSPYSHDYNLSKGSEYTVFEMVSANGKKYKFGTVICYEDTDPGVCRRMAVDKFGNKRIDWLVNISNDGWFTREKASSDDYEVLPSTELAQHTAISIFRAVENRLSIVRSVNTGVSCMINSLGEIENGYKNGNLPKKWQARAGEKGWLAGQVFVDKRVTLFSRFGRGLEICCGVLCTLILVMTIYRKKVQNKG